MKASRSGTPSFFLEKDESRGMTIEDASKAYGIPMSILSEYERWGLCGEAKKVMGAWNYDETDIERLSLILTLNDAGFSNEEIRRYMLLMPYKDSARERMEILREKRDGMLNEIHFMQKQLDRLDYLRFQIMQSGKDNKFK